MNNLNLLIDANYLFYKTIHVAKAYKSSAVFLDTDEEKAQFIRKIATDFVHDIKLFRGYNKVIFCVDERSWRKDFYELYKTGRVKGTDINWDAFYFCMTEFLEIAKSKGCIISSIPKAEADDLIYLWSRYLLKKGEDAIIMSGDNDVTQLVDYNESNFVIVYNNNSTSTKITCKTGFINFIKEKTKNKISEIDVFELEESEDDDILSNSGYYMISDLRSSIDFVEINPIDVVFQKIMAGDKSDTIPSVWTWPSKSGNKTNRITELMASKIKILLENLNVLELLEDQFRQTELHNASQVVIGKDKPIDKEIFVKNLIRNINLVYLNMNVIPKYIINNFKLNVNDLFKNVCQKFDRIHLLKDTKYEKQFEVYASIFNQPLDNDEHPVILKNKKLF